MMFKERAMLKSVGLRVGYRQNVADLSKRCHTSYSNVGSSRVSYCSSPTAQCLRYIEQTIFVSDRTG